MMIESTIRYRHVCTRESGISTRCHAKDSTKDQIDWGITDAL